jgi:hypothetical protein
MFYDVYYSRATRCPSIAAAWHVRVTCHAEFTRCDGAQGLAAGLMLCISMMDLLPAAVEEIGFAKANVCFYIGVLFFAAIVYLIPEPSPASIKVDKK